MAVTSDCTIQLLFSGDITENVIQSALSNVFSPGKTDIVTLSIGDNTIAAPVVAGVISSRLTIIPPAANVNLIKLKQTGADAGVPLHRTDFTSIGLDTSFSFPTLILNVTVQIIGVRLIWS